MNSASRHSILGILIALPLGIGLVLSACSKVNAPVLGEYRAAINLKGGELPLQLDIKPAGDSSDNVTVSMKFGDRTLSATRVAFKDGNLTAQWPDIGTMDVDFDRNSMTGKLLITDAQGKPVTLPLNAKLDQHWRFLQQSGVDNADISGNWQLEALSTEEFNTAVSMQLTQRFDQVNGSLTLPDGRNVGVIGQIKGDDVYLGTLGYGRAVLLKGKVNVKGELRGDFWVNTAAAHPWVAKHSANTLAAEDAATRKVGLPWAVPVRQIQ
jgi:hypothetical protein